MTETNKSPLFELLKGYNQERTREAFDSHEAEAKALTDTALSENVPTEMSLCLELGLGLHKQATTDAQRLLSLPTLSQSDLDRLDSLRMALWHTEVSSVLVLPEARTQKVLEVVKELRKERKRLFGVIDVVWPEDETMQKTLASLKAGSGYADLGNDGLGIARLIRDNLSFVQERLQPKPLEESVEKIDKLSHLLQDLRQDATDATLQRVTEDIRKRMYTLFERAYTKVARGGTYLFEQTDPTRAAAYAPLYTGYLRLLKAQRDKPSNPL